jgi:hypothetical protein
MRKSPFPPIDEERADNEINDSWISFADESSSIQKMAAV